ncbi:MAG: hypothetical protein E7E99_08705, partial [Peptoniphilus lacydonensis]|nr:hypothetical protein [Peptoniphilus lacydonensis]
LESKITTYHTQYKEERYKPMDVIYKDWNDVLKVRTARSVEQKLLEESYERKDGEHLEVTMQQKEGKQTVVATRKRFEQTVGFYEAESAHEMAFLIKNYGYQAVDKQDQRKYAKAKEMARV